MELGPHPTIDARRVLVSTVDQLASTTALRVLADGGSAVDAAIAANAVLGVTQPHQCGLGGDLLALVHQGDGPPACLDSTGRAGSGADPDRLLAAGRTSMPYRADIASVTIPGCVDGWLGLHDRFGRLELARLLEPAAQIADEGFPASPVLVLAASLLADHPADGAAQLRAATHAGAVVRRPGVARALRAIGRHGRDGFYLGAFGFGLLELGGGEHTLDDLATTQHRWVDPLGLDVWGHRLWTPPPPSQGYLTLAGAWLAERVGLPADPDEAVFAHLLVESARAAGHDRLDVLHEHADGAALLAEARLAPRLAAIDPERAGAGTPPASAGDTTYLCVVDGDGMAVSLIQSNCGDFGSHLFEPSTGINLHNRGIGFRLGGDGPAAYGPRRRPPSTLSPALVTRPGGTLRAVLGTQGGDTQPQVLLHLLARLLHAGQRPGTCLDGARALLVNHRRSFTLWEPPQALAVAVEGHAPAAWVDGLAARGHDVVPAPPWDAGAGLAHLIERTDDGLAGADDPRAGIGAALGW